MYNKTLIFLLLSLLGSTALADRIGNVYSPQPISCVTAKFSQSGGKYWTNVALQLTNHCQQPINLQNSSIQFNTSNNIQSLWGKFPGLTYPKLDVTSQGNTVAVVLIFPHSSKWWKPKTKLAVGSSIELDYGVPHAAYDPKSVRVYAHYHPQRTGTIELHNNSAQPSTGAQDPIIDIVDKNSQQLIKKIKAPWKKMTSVPNLIPNDYEIEPENLLIGSTPYRGAARPTNVTVTANAQVKSTITYTKTAQDGKVNIRVLAAKALSGYTKDPEVTLTNVKTGATHKYSTAWNKITTVNQLIAGDTYKLASDKIKFNGYVCTAKFTPSNNIIAHTTHVATNILYYVCHTLKTDPITIRVSGLKDAATIHAVNVTFVPNNHYPTVKKTICVVHGVGSATVNLIQGAIYNVSSDNIAGYTASFVPQPLAVTSQHQTEVILYKKVSPTGNFIFSPYKDTSINMDWNKYIISTAVTGTRQPLVNILTRNSNRAVTLAFATGSCRAPNWGDVASSVLARNNVSTLVKNNINYIISTGGAAGTFSCNCVTDMNNFLNTFASKNFLGLDFDIESSTDFTALMKTTAAVQRQWQQQGKTLRVSLTLATLAVKGQTVNPLGQAALQAAQQAGLKFNVNLMVMDYGSNKNCQHNAQGQCDMAASAIFAAKEFSQMYHIPLNRIELTPMIGENDTSSEVTTVSDIVKIAQFAKQNSLAGLHFWSFDRDTPCTLGGGLYGASPTCNSTSKAPLAYDQAALKAVQGP